ncbi:MAG: hypothetical protein Q9187_005936, partial [Circinaria calcarea]
MSEVPRLREGERGSTSSDFSSPPKSPDSPNAHTDTLSNAPITYPTLSTQSSNVRKVGGEKSGSLNASTAKNKSSSAVTAPRRQRKTKDPTQIPSGHDNTSTPPEAKVKKTRKPRAPAAATQGRRKRTDVALRRDHPDIKAEPQESRVPNPVGPAQTTQSQFNFKVPEPSSTPSQNSNNEAIPNNHLAFLASGQTPTQTPIQIPVRSPGQKYDPIRSVATEPGMLSQASTNALPKSPPRSANRASESPSISSLIDPPTIPPAYPFPKLAMPTSFPSNPSRPSVSAHSSPSIPSISGPSPRRQPSPTISPPMRTATSVDTSNATISNSSSTVMDVDSEPGCPPPTKVSTAPRKSNTGTSTGPSSKAPSPKPPRSRNTPLPGLPPLFGGAYESSELEKTAPTVILYVPLNGEINKVVNFARMAEEQYGFDALYPRLAAQRERLARVAAAGAALENANKAANNAGRSVSGGQSADDMSVDGSDGEGEGGGECSNVEMGGMASTGEGAKPTQPKKRKMKEDQYNKEDPFIDDSELAWEEQAAASKDGFFVYSGPLVPEGEKPTIERADGTVKRGRGRGRGSSTRGSGAGRGGATGGGTTGTRGNPATRKPRVTKAAKALMDQEMREREKMAVLAAKPMG